MGGGYDDCFGHSDNSVSWHNGAVRRPLRNQKLVEGLAPAPYRSIGRLRAGQSASLDFPVIHHACVRNHLDVGDGCPHSVCVSEDIILHSMGVVTCHSVGQALC